MEYLKLLDKVVNDEDHTFSPYGMKVSADRAVFVCTAICYRDGLKLIHFGTVENHDRGAEIAASALQTAFPEFEIKADHGNVNISYKPKTPKEYEEINLWKEKKWQEVFS